MSQDRASCVDDVVARGRAAWPDVEVPLSVLAPLAARAFPDGMIEVAHAADLADRAPRRTRQHRAPTN